MEMVFSKNLRFPLVFRRSSGAQKWENIIKFEKRKIYLENNEWMKYVAARAFWKAEARAKQIEFEFVSEASFPELKEAEKKTLKMPTGAESGCDNDKTTFPMRRR